MRLGWLAVPPGLRATVLAGKAAADLGGPVLEQLAFAELLAAGEYDRHLRRARRVHRERRYALVEAGTPAPARRPRIRRRGRPASRRRAAAGR
jgi:GntR family transcriptional regulator/MocR family aminotransferase